MPLGRVSQRVGNSATAMPGSGDETSANLSKHASGIDNQEPQPNACVRFSQSMDGTLQRGFYSLGLWTGSNPWKMLMVSVLFAVITGAGLTQLQNEARREELWTPKGSASVKNAKLIESAFGQQPRGINVYITSSSPGNNILTGPAMRQAMLLVLTGENATATANHRDIGSRVYTYDDLCQRREAGGGQQLCTATTILDAWSGLADFDAQAAAAGGLDSYDVAAYLSGRESAGTLNDRFGVSITLDTVLGGISRNAAGNLTAAAAMQHSFELRNDAYTVEGEEVDPAAEEWELAYDDVVGRGFSNGFQATLPLIQAVSVTNSGFRSEGLNFLAGDLSLVVAAVGIIIVYVFLQFSECSRVGSRATLALAGIVTVGLALLICYGLGSITTFFTPVHSVLPFLLFGIGVDDVFVIAGAFSRTRAGEPVHLRVAKAMQHAGSSVLLTSVTDALAFGISATTSLPALGAFAIWALWGIVGAFVMSCTFFVAVLTLDARRQEAGRYDCCCCWVDEEVLADVNAARAALVAEKKAGPGATACVFESTNPIRSTSPGPGAVDNARDAVAPQWGSRKEFVGTRPRKVFLCVQAGRMAEAIEFKYAPALLSLPGQIVVGVVFAALIGVSSVGLANLTVEFRQEWFLPGDSYLQDSFTIQDQYFSGNGFPVWAYAENFHPVDHPDLLPTLERALRDNKYVNTDTAPVLNWYTAFGTFLAESAARNASGASGACGAGCPCYDTSISSPTVPTTVAAFDTAMEAFLCSPAFAFWGNSIRFTGGAAATSGTIRMTRVQAFYKVIPNALDEADAMETTIAAVNDAGDEAGVGADSVFAYSPTYGQWEQYVVVPREAVTNVGLSIACVAVVVALLLADLLTSLIVTLVVGSCLLNILGFMHFWGVSLDAVSVVFLVLAVGLSIDYSAHIAHAFLHTQGATRAERARKSLGEMGVSVINGATSTFLAVIVLSPSGSYVFLTLFRVFFLSSVLGAAHGLVLLPVVLLWFGPEAHPEEEPLQVEDEDAVPKDTGVAKGSVVDVEVGDGKAGPVGTAQ